MLVIRNIGQLCSMNGTAEDALGRIPDAALVARDGRVEWLGPQAQLPAVSRDATVVDAQGQAVLPGLVECHTHLVFAGDRVGEYARRARGESYQQIAAAGGGILSSVRATRGASLEELVRLALPRLRALLRHGVTTCEVKSGYGLTLEDELKMLRAVKALRDLQPVELVATFLGAHTCPAEFAGRPDDYVQHVVQDMIPAVAREGLAQFVDVFVEQVAFTPDQARRIAAAARAHGMGIKLHVDQLSSGAGAELAAELGAASADHLDHTTANGVLALVKADVTGVLLPTAQVFLGHARKAPGRAMADAGMSVAVSTDFNPGTSPCVHLPLAATLAVSQCGLTVPEALLGITRHAAKAVGRADLGRLAVGGPCDAVVLERATPEHLLYEMGGDIVGTVVKGGRIIHQRPAA